MSRKLPRISPLEMRKDLLIAESELNRAQLRETWDAATEWQGSLSAGARVAGSIASAAALVASGVRAFRNQRGSQNGAEVSWLQPLIKGAGLIATLCGAFRSRGSEERKK
jgi:hypothetical protein